MDYFVANGHRYAKCMFFFFITDFGTNRFILNSCVWIPHKKHETVAWASRLDHPFRILAMEIITLEAYVRNFEEYNAYHANHTDPNGTWTSS